MNDARVFCPLCRIKRRNEDVAVGPVPLRPLDTGDDVELLVQFTVPLPGEARGGKNEAFAHQAAECIP